MHISNIYIAIYRYSKVSRKCDQTNIVTIMVMLMVTIIATIVMLLLIAAIMIIMEVMMSIMIMVRVITIMIITYVFDFMYIHNYDKYIYIYILVCVYALCTFACVCISPSHFISMKALMPTKESLTGSLQSLSDDQKQNCFFLFSENLDSADGGKTAPIIVFNPLFTGFQHFSNIQGRA